MSVMGIGCDLWATLLALGGLGTLGLKEGSNLPGFSNFASSRASKNPKCCARTDPRSSMGVKMLRDLEEIVFGR